MIEILLPFAKEFLVATIYSLLISGLVYILCIVAARKISLLVSWRDYWMFAIVGCIIPMFYIFLPEPVIELSNLSLYQLVVFTESTTTLNAANSSLDNLKPTLSWPSYMALAWLIIFCCALVFSLIRFFIRCVQLKQVLKGSLSLEQSSFDNKTSLTQKHLNILNRIQGIKGVKVLVSEKFDSPFVTELPNKVLVIPTTTFDDLTHEQFLLMLRHELTHLKSHDGLATFLTQLIKCFLWFNPFIFSLIHRMNWAIETSCDTAVLSRKPNLRRTYAQAMLKILRRSATNESNQLVAAFSSKLHRSITMRITHIMNPSSKGSKSYRNKVCLWSGAFSIFASSLAFHPSLNASPIDTVSSVTTAAATVTVTNMINPVSMARISSSFGAKDKLHKYHEGIDLAASLDTPIVAAAGGKVILSTNLWKGRKNYGTIIIIEHDNGLQSLYSHLNSRSVFLGDSVKKGQLIGKVGETGRTTGPHLHLEIISNNKRVDPASFINFES